jgi:protein-disulfide isomerase
MHFGNLAIMSTASLKLRILLSCALTACLGAATAAAQQPAPDQGSDLVTLKNDVQQLKAQQQLILDRLDELKKLLNKGSANAQPAVNAPDTMSVKGELFRGEATATVAIIEYGDIECPYCRRFKRDIYPQLVNAYIKTGKVKFYYRDMPLPFHEHAMPAAQAAHCAGEQGKFWEMQDSLFADKTAALATSDINDHASKLGLDTAKLDACMTSDRFAEVIRHSSEEAAKMNIEGTPTFLIGILSPDGDVVNVKKPIIGALPFDAFRSAIDPLLSPDKASNASPDPHTNEPVSGGVTAQLAAKN